MVKVGNKLVRARQYPWGVVVGKMFGGFVCFWNDGLKLGFCLRNLKISKIKK